MMGLHWDLTLAVPAMGPSVPKSLLQSRSGSCALPRFTSTLSISYVCFPDQAPDLPIAMQHVLPFHCCGDFPFLPQNAALSHAPYALP